MRLLELPAVPLSPRKRRRQYTEDRLSQIIRTLRSRELWPDPDTTYIRLMQSCAMMNAIAEGKQVHIHMIKYGLRPNNHLWLTLISMYAKCGCFREAHHVLDSMPYISGEAAAALITAYTHWGHDEDALGLFSEMLWRNLKANEAVIACALKACAGLLSLENGKLVHFFTIENGYETYLLVQNSLLKMYCKCHSLSAAEKIFWSMKERNLVSWTVLLAGFANHGYNEDALNHFQEMLNAGFKADNVAFASILKVSTNMRDLRLGRQIHEQIKGTILQSDVLLNNILIVMYAKCGTLKEAHKVFHQMRRRDAVSWNEIITAYVQHGQYDNAFKIVEEMIRHFIKPDITTVTMMMNTCINLGDLGKCKMVHSHIMKSGFKSNTTVLNNILDMYIKCNAIQEARLVFDRRQKRDAGTWKTMILGYVQCGYDKEALGLFHLMQEDSIKPDSLTFTGLLNACANLRSLVEGKLMHKHVIISCHESHFYVSSAIIDMYAKCGSLEDAFNVFQRSPDQDVVSWNSMIVGFCQTGQSDNALQLFHIMQEKRLTPSATTLVSTLNACANSGTLDQGKAIHGHVIRSGLENEIFIGSAIVDMYAKSGSLMNAYNVFVNLKDKDVVPWTTMIVGLARHGFSRDAISLFVQMLEENIKPNKVTYAGMLVACSHSGLLEEGFCYFNFMDLVHGVSPSADHHACVVDLFARAGLLEEAEHFAYRMPFRTHYESWMSLFNASKIHGDLDLAERASCKILCD